MNNKNISLDLPSGLTFSLDRSTDQSCETCSKQFRPNTPIVTVSDTHPAFGSGSGASHHVLCMFRFLISNPRDFFELFRPL